MSKIYIIVIGLAILWLLYKMSYKKDKIRKIQNGIQQIPYNYSLQPRQTLTTLPTYLQEHAMLLQEQQNHYQYQNQHQFNDSNAIMAPNIQTRNGTHSRGFRNDVDWSDCAGALLEAYFGMPNWDVRRNNAMSSGYITTSTSLPSRYSRTNAESTANEFPKDHMGQPYRVGKGGRRIYKRKRVGERLRKVVAAEQLWRCQECQMLLNADFEVDHLTPVFEGGTNDQSNLRALCRNCHGKKSTKDGLRGGF
jgi:hypothetical protein